MAEFGISYKKTAKIEGGYVNDRDDHGGETYAGISRKHWEGWEGWPLVDSMKTRHDFPKCLDSDKSLAAMRESFYRRNFWSKYLEQMPQIVADWLYDKCVNMGTRQANRLLQRALGVTDDGIIGQATMSAIAKADEGELVQKCRLEAQDFYRGLVAADESQRKFLKGWLARA